MPLLNLARGKPEEVHLMEWVTLLCLYVRVYSMLKIFATMLALNFLLTKLGRGSFQLPVSPLFLRLSIT